MAKLALCMIVRNEEDRLETCLESVKDAVDEMVIVDTGSTDRTKEIAARYTDKVFDFVWSDDFSAARNTTISPFFVKMRMDTPPLRPLPPASVVK